MPPFGVLIVLSVSLLLLDPGDWIGELKGAVAVLIPVILYWLKKRHDDQDRDKNEAHETADSMLRYSSEREKRLEERASSLREEERAFMHQQMKLSRERGHVLADGYMSVEFTNDQLIELLRKNNIDIPESLMAYRTRANVLFKLKELEERYGMSNEGSDKAN